MIFCPYCANMLNISADSGHNKFACRTCPYEYPLAATYTQRTHLVRKEVDDVMGGKGTWDNVDSTRVDCKNDLCDNDRAFYMQIQIRSADEPSTTFYRCTRETCAFQWREN